MRLGVVGATGLVGVEMARIIEKRIRAPSCDILAFASRASAGKTLDYAGKRIEIRPFEAGAIERGDYLLGATTAEIASEWVPAALERGAVIIDNSSRFRMDEGVPLVVPEVNMASVPGGCRLIANPNCSTIQLVMVLHPLLRVMDIEWVAVSTYQSVSGGGYPAVRTLEAQERGIGIEPRRDWFHRNVLPGIGSLDDSLYCDEESKLARETVKILGRFFPVFPSCARVPVEIGHLEAVTVRFAGEMTVEEAARILYRVPGVRVSESGVPPIAAAGTDEVHVGGIRRSPADGRVLQMWITADNVRKGAALNAVQILEALLGSRLSQ